MMPKKASVMCFFLPQVHRRKAQAQFPSFNRVACLEILSFVFFLFLNCPSARDEESDLPVNGVFFGFFFSSVESQRGFSVLTACQVVPSGERGTSSRESESVQFEINIRFTSCHKKRRHKRLLKYELSRVGDIIIKGIIPMSQLAETPT